MRPLLALLLTCATASIEQEYILAYMIPHEVMMFQQQWCASRQDHAQRRQIMMIFGVVLCLQESVQVSRRNT